MLRLAQARMRDVHELRYLQCEKSYEDRVGGLALRTHVLRRAVAQVRANLPQLSLALKSTEEVAATAFQLVLHDAGGLNAAKAKGFALGFVQEFIESLEQALNGIMQPNPVQFGLSLDEEHFAGWKDDAQRLIGRAPAPNVAKAKVVGAQQFQRLQGDLREFFSSIQFDKLPATAEFPVPAHVAPNSEQANRVAAEWVHSVLSRSVWPVLQQACERALFALLHAWVVYDARFAVHVQESEARGSWVVLAHSPHFRLLVRQRYEEFVRANHEALGRELREDMLSAETLYWTLVSDSKKYAPAAKAAPKMIEVGGHGHEGTHRHGGLTLPKEVQAQFQEEMHRVEMAQVLCLFLNRFFSTSADTPPRQRAKLYTPHEVASRLFRVQTTRIARNASLKLYKFMLEPLVQGALLEHLTRVVEGLDMDATAQLFNLAAVREKYALRRADLQGALDRLALTKDALSSSSQSFLRFVSAVP
jgi:hypothetical protein